LEEHPEAHPSEAHLVHPCLHREEHPEVHPSEEHLRDLLRLKEKSFGTSCKYVLFYAKKSIKRSIWMRNKKNFSTTLY
jgi:hypothetical protein